MVNSKSLYKDRRKKVKYNYLNENIYVILDNSQPLFCLQISINFTNIAYVIFHSTNGVDVNINRYGYT